ncbi:Putative MetA-pathway of phenol degradation [Methylomagnum ishizawai]|uniref:MetA-pathway of phenol degradation n=1 Tax=Methylomagnum ishizawai TaxID=1760988 RepID=A0A1Y6D8Y7_9GAMM|nr:transporter [Methylomagnum ishizawai]SMF96872.1 Putative MetA-pathway of phenol degradation [Methylomagnum ishizawai]
MRHPFPATVPVVAVPVRWALLASVLAALPGCAQWRPQVAPAVAVPQPALPPLPQANLPYEKFREYGRFLARRLFWKHAQVGTEPRSADRTGFDGYQQFDAYADSRADQAKEEFFKGRYNRSRARLPENIERWRSEPDIANPGPDLANFPNSAFTLPQGRAYVEFSPFTYYGSAGKASPAQYNAEFLLRYGATDDIELRLFGNGVSWIGGSASSWGFSPIAFDTKIQMWTEKQDYFLPAAGFEAYIQTQWLGSAEFNGGTQPSFTFNFDQSLPWEIDLEYNLGATRVQDAAGNNDWEFSFQWGLQRDLFNKDFAVFVHGFYNAMTLPRLPNAQVVFGTGNNQFRQNAVGGGFVWTVNRRLSVYGQASGGTTRFTPSVLGMLGLALAF